MRVLLSAYGTRGAAEPLVGLAAQLRALGVSVRMCAQPHCVPRLGEIDVPLLPLEPSWYPVPRESTSVSAAEAGRQIAELIARQFEVISAAAVGCDAIVAAGIGQIAAHSVAESRGIPYVYASSGPAYLPSAHQAPVGWEQRLSAGSLDPRVLWEVDAASYNVVYRSALNAHRARIGLVPVSDVRAHLFTDRPWLAADPMLAPWRHPTELQVLQSGAWFLPDTRPLAADLEAFLDAGPPPIYMGFGSRRPSGDIASAVIRAARAHGRRTVVASGWAGLAPAADRADCFAVDEVNHQLLFTRVAAVVHHGGAGTTMTAARAGASQVVVPELGDQHYWGRRVAGLGIGVALDDAPPTPEFLSAALGIALSATTRAQATAVATAVRTDGAAVAARTLRDLVRASMGRGPRRWLARLIPARDRRLVER